jgi:hypothetical protein
VDGDIEDLLDGLIFRSIDTPNRLFDLMVAGRNGTDYTLFLRKNEMLCFSLTFEKGDETTSCFLKVKEKAVLGTEPQDDLLRSTSWTSISLHLRELTPLLGGVL